MFFRKKSLFSFFLFLFSFFVKSHMCNNAYFYQWKSTYVDKMSVEEQQLLANIIHLLHANAIIESKVRQFLTPIARLNQVIRKNVDHYKNSHEDVIALKKLLDRLSVVMGTRLIYNQILSTCITHYNKNTISTIDAALSDLQLYAQGQLREWSDQNEEIINAQLKKSSENITASIQPLQEISQLHLLMSEGQLPVHVDAHNQENKSLIKLSILLQNNPQLLLATDVIVNSLNETSDKAADTINVGIQIYKQFYSILYHSLMTSASNKDNATTLFGMHDMLPNQYKTTLPDPSKVFEHMLQNTKLYTQIEFLQS